MGDGTGSTSAMYSLPLERATTSALAQQALTRRYFVAQDRRPAHLGEVDLMELDPGLRGLLFTDGTVMRALEAQFLSRVSVEVVAQARSSASGHIASHLDVPDGTESVRRRVAIGPSGSATPAIWAESHILPLRLPPGFLSVLHDAPDGIGESLQQVKLESWRDLLWFGFDTPPKWNHLPPGTPQPTITRLYRVSAAGRPTLLISESFAVERRDGRYHLNWPV
jgi:chorismate-pyruvate lyase